MQGIDRAAGQAGGPADGCGDAPAGKAAGRRGGAAAVRRGGDRPPKQSTGGGGKKDRRQFTLPVELLRRLAVHCAITDESEHEIVAIALGGYLQRHGRTSLDVPAERPAPIEAEQDGNVATVQPPPPPAVDKLTGLRARYGGGTRPDTPEDRQDKRAG